MSDTTLAVSDALRPDALSSDLDAGLDVPIEEAEPPSTIARPFDYLSLSMLNQSVRPATALSFSEAMDAMKAGKAVRRAGGARLFVYMTRLGERFSDALGCTVFIGPDDVLATDWEIAGEAIGWRR